nr:MAG TPA: hypothetical protein [Caudoviricetes sp.]
MEPFSPAEADSGLRAPPLRCYAVYHSSCRLKNALPPQASLCSLR